MKLINKKSRKVLNEGRDYQMGFAFVKKLEKNVYETVQPISPCKDYLNDVLFSELTGKEMQAFGLVTKKENIFNKKGYIAFKICKSYSNLTKDKQNLNNNIVNVTKFMNTFEKLLGTTKTVIGKVADLDSENDNDNKDIFIATVPSKFLLGTYSISLYSLLLRISQWYDGEQDVMEYVKNFKEFNADIYLVKEVVPKLERLIKEGLHKQELPNIGGHNVHNMGIIGYKW